MYYIPFGQLQFKVNWIENVFYVASVSISAESTIDYIKYQMEGGNVTRPSCQNEFKKQLL